MFSNLIMGFGLSLYIAATAFKFTIMGEKGFYPLSTGSLIVNVVPFPSWLSTSMVP